MIDGKLQLEVRLAEPHVVTGLILVMHVTLATRAENGLDGIPVLANESVPSCYRCEHPAARRDVMAAPENEINGRGRVRADDATIHATEIADAPHAKRRDGDYRDRYKDERPDNQLELRQFYLRLMRGLRCGHP